MKFLFPLFLAATTSCGVIDAFFVPSPTKKVTTTGTSKSSPSTKTTELNLSIEDIFADLKLPETTTTATLQSLSLPENIQLDQELKQIQESFSSILNGLSGDAAGGAAVLDNEQVNALYKQAVDVWDNVISVKVVPLLEAAGINPTDIVASEGIPSDLLLLFQDVPPSAMLLAAAVTTYWMVSTVLTLGKPPPSSKPYPLQKYNPFTAQEYFDNKPIQAVQRSLQIATMSLGFGVTLIKDKIE